MQEKVSYSVDVVGEETGKTYAGVFEVKTSLSFRESLKEDEIRRTVLGVNPADAGPYAQSIASVLAYLAVRVVDAPEWWRQVKNGSELKDPNVLEAVNVGAVEAIDKERSKLTRAAEEALSALKEKLPTP